MGFSPKKNFFNTELNSVFAKYFVRKQVWNGFIETTHVTKKFLLILIAVTDEEIHFGKKFYPALEANPRGPLL